MTISTNSTSASASDWFARHMKPWHVALVLTAGLVTFGIGIGRFEAKSTAQEQRIDRVETETRRGVEEFKNEVIRHLDDLSLQTRRTDERIDRQSDVLRDLAADVAVLCAESKGSGCSQRR